MFRNLPSTENKAAARTDYIAGAGKSRVIWSVYNTPTAFWTYHIYSTVIHYILKAGQLRMRNPEIPDSRCRRLRLKNLSFTASEFPKIL